MNNKLIIAFFVAVCFCSIASVASKSLRGSSTDISFLTDFATTYLKSEGMTEDQKQDSLKLLKILVQDHRRFTLVIKGFLVFFDYDHNGIVTFEDIQNRVLSVLQGFPQGIKQAVLSKISNLRPLIQRLDLNRNGGIDIKTEGKIIAFILRSILLNKLQHIYLHNLEMAMLDLLTCDCLELVDASLNKKLKITTEQQIDVIKFFKASTIEMISIQATSQKFNLKKLGLQFIHNFVHIYFDDAVLFKKLFRLQFQFFDENGDNVLYISEVQNYIKHVHKRYGIPFSNSHKQDIRYVFNRYLKTHFQSSQGHVSWQQLKQKINKIRIRHMKFVRRALKNLHQVK